MMHLVPVFLTLCAATVATPEVLTLERAVDLVRTKNIDIQIAKERLAGASVLSKKAWSLLLPTLSTNGSFVRNSKEIELDFAQMMSEGAGLDLSAFGATPPDSEPIVIQQLYDRSAMLNMNWRLLNGRSIPLIKNAYDSVDVAKLVYKQTELGLEFATRIAYYAALNANEQVAARKRALENAKAHLQLAEAKVSVGQATRVDVLRSETEVAAAEQLLLRTENAMRIAYRGLAKLIDWIDDRGEARPFTIKRPKAGPQLPEPAKLLTTAYDARIDLEVGRLQLQITERTKTETWMKFLPVLSATGHVRWSESAGFTGENTTWQVGLSLQWEFFSGGITYWELHERTHDINQAALAIEKNRQDIAQQVADARLNLESAQASHRVAQRQAQLARETANLIEAQYEVGAATQLDVLDANRMLADAETNEGLMQLSVDLSRISLEQVLVIPPAGGGAGATPGAEGQQSAAPSDGAKQQQSQPPPGGAPGMGY